MRGQLMQLEALLAALTGSQGIDELTNEQTAAALVLAHGLAHEALEACPEEA